MSQAAEKRGAKPAMLKDTAFVWEDPLDLEGELTEEERMVRDTRARLRAGQADAARRSRPSATRNSTATSCRRWASSACSARRSRKNMAARGSAMSPTG